LGRGNVRSVVGGDRRRGVGGPGAGPPHPRDCDGSKPADGPDSAIGGNPDNRALLPYTPMRSVVVYSLNVACHFISYQKNNRHLFQVWCGLPCYHNKPNAFSYQNFFSHSCSNSKNNGGENDDRNFCLNLLPTCNRKHVTCKHVFPPQRVRETVA